jgi:hypothetical protein
MSWHITKTSILSSSVPTDGVMYYVSKNHWTNLHSDRKIFSTREDAVEEIKIDRIGQSEIPNGVQIIEE